MLSLLIGGITSSMIELATHTPSQGDCPQEKEDIMRRTLNIRTLIVVALVAAMPPAALGQQVKKEGEKTNNVEQQILSLEKEWYDAFFRSDADTMSRIEADDFIIITGGTKTPLRKEQQLANIRGRSEERKRQASTLTRSFEDPIIRFYGDVAVVNGVQTVTSKAGTAGNTDGKALYTGVWVKQGGRWRIVNAQWTGLPQQ